MIFIHWGEDYNLSENHVQQEIAQHLCDVGFDVIIGSHPYVVQPVTLIESTVDLTHKAVCIYSVGNLISNQRNGYVVHAPAYYTEDGALFEVTFEKYSNGKVRIADMDVIPTWVNMHSNNGKREYNILPLVKEHEENWIEMFGLTEEQLIACKNSYRRTTAIVEDGVQLCKEHLN